MWHGVPFACQRRPIVGVLRMCWLLPGSFDCVCCPHTSVHRPSIACLAVFLCGPGALFLHALSGPSTICSFPPHGWSAPDGLPLLLRKQPIWAAGDTPHLMPVEQGLPWHPVATGLAGQAIPFIVAASHAHALPSAPFWFSVPAVPVASPTLLCPSSLSVVPALVPPGVAPAFCVSVLLLPLSGGAPGCPCRAPPPVPPACPPIRGFHISTQRGLPRARLAVHGPVATPVAGTSRSAGRSPRPCGVRGHLVEGGGVFADGSLGVRCIWWLLQCSHLMVPLCVLLGLVSLPCVGRPCAQLFCCLRSSQFRALSFSAGLLTASGLRRQGGSMSLPASHCGCWVVPLAVGWCKGHQALLHMSPNLQTDLSLVFVGVVLG